MKSSPKQPEVGKEYIVSCIILGHEDSIDERWRDDDQYLNTKRQEKLAPVHPNLHDDFESGQFDKHFHLDTRFAPNKRSYPIEELRLYGYTDKDIVYRKLKCLHKEEQLPSHSSVVNPLKLVHTCIVDGRCPHKGYDLSSIQPINEVITCPLHGLKFLSETGKLIEDES